MEETTLVEGATEAVAEVATGVSKGYTTILNWAKTTGLRLLIAIILLVVIFKLINKLGKKLEEKLEKKVEGHKNVDKTVVRTVSYLVKIALKVVVVIILANFVGLETSSLSALVASLGVCVGLAVNGTLSNLAGGVMILLTRPFKLGDYIAAQGEEGVVADIRICHTRIVTVDNKSVYLPNSGLSTGSIVNFSEEETRMIRFDFSVAGNDPEKVRSLLNEVAASNELVLKDPAPFVRLVDFGLGNGVKMSFRVWCKGGDYWTVYSDMLEKTQQVFDANGIVIPFNQLDVHLKQN